MNRKKALKVMYTTGVVTDSIKQKPVVNNELLCIQTPNNLLYKYYAKELIIEQECHICPVTNTQYYDGIVPNGAYGFFVNVENGYYDIYFKGSEAMSRRPICKVYYPPYYYQIIWGGETFFAYLKDVHCRFPFIGQQKPQVYLFKYRFELIR